MAPRRRMGRYSATVVPYKRGPKRGFQPPTRQLDRKRRSDRCRLRLASGWPGIPPKHFEPAADPAAMLGSYRVHRLGPVLSGGTRSAKNRSAFLRDLSLKLACFVIGSDP